MKTFTDSSVGTFSAEGDYSAANMEYRLVVPGTSVEQVKIPAADTDIAIGVMLNIPAAGENASVRFLNSGGSCWMRAVAAISVGDFVVAALVADTTHYGKIRTMTGITTETVYIVGRALEAATAEDDLIEVLLLPAIQRVIA